MKRSVFERGVGEALAAGGVVKPEFGDAPVQFVDVFPRTDDGKIDFAEDFFGREAFLTVSGQLSVESYCLAMRNVYTFGQASDMAEFAPMPRISSIIDNWAPYYIDRVQAIIDGTWESQNVWQGIGDGMVGIGEISDAVPADVKEEALALKAALADGSYHPFTGPINKQDGSPWLAEAEVADDGTRLGMNFYVEGITGEIPQ